ncbi:MAG: PEP-CTERM sorting domain-containing protein, partial [Verrucomicrobiales bacterium]
TLGYLTTPGDLTTFVAISSTFYAADSQINTIGDDTFADFETSTVIADGNAAIGNEFAIQVTFSTPSAIPGGSTAARQSTLDYVRVAVPEPSSFALICLGLAGTLIRRRR